MKYDIVIKKGVDTEGEFLKHGLSMDGLTAKLTRHYYKTVEWELLKNMPLDTLMETKIEIDMEIKRRNND